MLTRARTIAALPAAGLALTLLAGGCGNDTDPKSVESTKPPTTLASPSTSAEAPTESTADTPESTTSTVTAATADVSGVGYMDGFRFELTGAEFGETSSGQSGLLVEADLENLNKDSDQRFDPSVSLEDSDGKAINGGVVADLVPSGSSSSATFEFNAVADRGPGVLFASGYIAGGAIAGILIAFLAGVMGDFDAALQRRAAGHNPFYAGPYADLLTLLPFLVLTLLLWLAARR